MKQELVCIGTLDVDGRMVTENTGALGGCIAKRAGLAARVTMETTRNQRFTPLKEE